jgi:uncharacterized protein (DUF433 family)
VAQELATFSVRDAATLSGASVWQVGYWDREGMLRPTWKGPQGRFYTFRDIVGLRTITTLRKRHGRSLQQLRKIQPYLREHSETPWASLRLGVAGREVVFADPDNQGSWLSADHRNQSVMPVDLVKISHDVTAGVRKLRERGKDDYGGVERHRDVQRGAWVVKGTRIPTASIAELHGAGYSADKIIARFPTLRAEDVRAAIRHEGKQSRRAS